MHGKLVLLSKPTCEIGYIWVYENIAVYSKRGKLDLGRRLRKQAGSRLGIVKALIPTDPYCVLYQRLTHTKAWLKRHPEDKYQQQPLFAKKR